MMDAIHVPCWPQLELFGEVFNPVKLGPWMTVPPDRSDTPGYTPLSITATVTPLPSVTCHARSTFIMLKTHCCESCMASVGALAPAAAGSAGSKASPTATPALASIRPSFHGVFGIVRAL